MLGANKETASLRSAHTLEVFAKNRAWTRRRGGIDLRSRTRKEETENNVLEHSQGPEKEER
jgi:hypothetical protein